MKKNRVFAAALCAALLATGSAAASSVMEIPLGEDGYPPIELGQENYIPYRSESKVVFEELITLENGYRIAATDADGQITHYNVDGETLFMDAEEGVPFSLETLQKGDEISIFHDGKMASSAPPQIYAEAVVKLSDKEGGGNNVTLHTAEQVYRNENGTVTILTDNGSLLLNISDENPLTPYLTRQLVSANDIMIGSRVFAWYDIILTSYPGQAGASRAVLAPVKNQTMTILTQGDIAIAQARTEGNVIMVPLRAVAEMHSFTVEWDGEIEGITLAKDELTCSLLIGQDAYIIGGETHSFLAAPYEEEGTTWVPADFFALVLGEKAVTARGSILYS